MPEQIVYMNKGQNFSRCSSALADAGREGLKICDSRCKYSVCIPFRESRVNECL